MHLEYRMQRYWLVAGLAAAVMLAGCTGQSSQRDSETVFMDLVSQQQSSTYHVSYTADGTLRGDPGRVVSDMELNRYRYQGRPKSVVTVTASGRQWIDAAFRTQDRKLTCFDVAAVGESGDASFSCSLEDSEWQFIDQFTDAKNFRLNLSGTREIAGRTCQAFTAVPTANTAFNIAGATKDGNGMTITLCVDKAQGYLAYVSVNATSTSELSGEKTQNLFTLRAISHDTDVTADDVALPVSAIMDVYCDEEPHVRITPLEQLQQPELTVNGESLSWSGSAPFTPMNVSIPISALNKGTNNVTLSTGTEGRRKSCTYYGPLDTSTDDSDTDTPPGGGGS